MLVFPHLGVGREVAGELDDDALPGLVDLLELGLVGSHRRNAEGRDVGGHLDVLDAGLGGEVDDGAEEEAVHEELHDAVGVARHQQRRRRDPLPLKSFNFIFTCLLFYGKIYLHFFSIKSLKCDFSCNYWLLVKFCRHSKLYCIQ